MTPTRANESDWFFEDFHPGEVYRSKARTLTEADLVGFIGLAGFFEETFMRAPAVKSGEPIRRMLPGVMVLALAEGLFVLSGRMEHGLILLEMNELRFSQRVYCGDTITSVVQVSDAYPTRSGRRGVVVLDQSVESDGRGQVLTYRTRRVIARRRVESTPESLGR